MAEIEFGDKWFSKTFWDLKKASSRHVVVRGGAASSKSYSAYQMYAIGIMQEKKHDYLAMRKHGSDLFLSIYTGIKLIIEDWGLGDLFEFRFSNEKREIVYKETGRKIIFRGLDDTEKIKSIVNIKRIMLEEANEFEFSDIRELNRRVRGIEGIQIHYIFNPVIESHWLKVKLFDEKVFKNIDYLHFTYKDNISAVTGKSFLTKEDIEELENYKYIDDNDYIVYCKGEWGKARSGQEFFKNFNAVSHVGTPKLNHSLPLHISIDNNVYPYIAVVVWQADLDRKRIWQVAEIPCKHPINSASGAGKETLKWLHRNKWENSIFIYGDPTTKNRNTIDDNKKTFLDKYLGVLSQSYTTTRRFFNVAPPVGMTADFINALWNNWEDWNVTIHEDCIVSIEDYRFTKADANGLVFKERTKDKVSGITYEKRGHFVDGGRYFICKFLESEYNRFSKRHTNFSFIIGKRESKIRMVR